MQGKIEAGVVIKYLVAVLIAGSLLWGMLPFILLYLFVVGHGPPSGGG